jgi:hypothetical protein
MGTSGQVHASRPKGPAKLDQQHEKLDQHHDETLREENMRREQQQNDTNDKENN